MDWRLVLSTASGWFLRRDWQDGMGGGGTLDGGELSSSWTEHEDDPVLTPKVYFCVVHGLLEKRSELVRLVASVQKAVKEELEFLRDVLRIQAKLMDAEDVSEY